MAGKERMTRIAKGATGQVDALLADIRGLILAARRAVVRSVDTLQVLTSFEIGRRIVEHEQQGAARAEYGEHTLRELAERLTAEFGRGFSRSNLQNMRNFFLVYRDRQSQICQMPSGKLEGRRNGVGSLFLTRVQELIQGRYAAAPALQLEILRIMS